MHFKHWFEVADKQNLWETGKGECGYSFLYAVLFKRRLECLLST